MANDLTVVRQSMQLVHYTGKPQLNLQRKLMRWFGLKPRQEIGMKPRGLWVSDDSCKDNWHSWCTAENFRTELLTHAHDVSLKPDAKIMILKSAEDIDTFTRAFAVEKIAGLKFNMFINWPQIADNWQGIIITPYIWERRLSVGEGPDSTWYYGWDCASGCIWDMDAIQSITLRQQEKAA